MKDNIIEAISSFRNYLSMKYDINKDTPIELFSISDTNINGEKEQEVRLNNKLIGFTKYEAKTNKFIGFKTAYNIRIKPRQTYEIGDYIKKNGIFKRKKYCL